MKQQNSYGTIAALTLGLCLVAAYALASDASSDAVYDLINSSGGTIQAKCTGDSSYSDVANGTTQSFTCSGNLAVRVAGATQSLYNISRQCYGGPTEVTVTAGANAGELNFSLTC